MIEENKFKKDFPIFKNYPDLSYLDNSATTQVPTAVEEATKDYYEKFRANSHSKVYKLGIEASRKYEEAREIVAKFFNAQTDEIIFTSGTTHSLNILAQSLGKKLKKGDNVVMTRMEHHSNLVSWLEASKEYGFELRFIDLKDYELDLDSAKKLIDKNTKVVSFVHISNALGTVNDAKKIITMAKSVGALTVVDAAQSAPHIKIDVKELDCDYLALSGHKMGGPSGIGVLYGKQENLESLDPFMFGGGMISEVSYECASWGEIPHRFEAGSTNAAGAIGLGAALRYLEKIGMENIVKHEMELTEYAIAKMEQIEKLKIIGPKKNRSGVISFTIEGIHPHDVAAILDKHNVAVRAGHHCTMPLMGYLGINGTTRASFWIYNDKKDVDKLIDGIKEAIKVFEI